MTNLRRSGAPGLLAVGAVATAPSRGPDPVASPALSPRPRTATCPTVLVRGAPAPAQGGLTHWECGHGSLVPGWRGDVGAHKHGGRAASQAVPGAVGTKSLGRAGLPHREHGGALGHHQPDLLSSQRRKGQGPLGLTQQGVATPSPQCYGYAGPRSVEGWALPLGSEGEPCPLSLSFSLSWHFMGRNLTSIH